MWEKKPYAARHNINNVVINRKLDSNDLLLNHKTISYSRKSELKEKSNIEPSEL